jgi:hypothetical protein
MTREKHQKRRRSRRAGPPRTQADLVVTLSGLAASIAIVNVVLTGSDSLQRYGAPWLVVVGFLLVGAATAMLALVGLGYRLARTPRALVGALRRTPGRRRSQVRAIPSRGACSATPTAAA